MKFQKLNDYQYEELQKGVLLINKYDLSLKYLYEMNPYWKEFFFDLMEKISEKGNFYVRQEKGESLLDYFKRDYQNLIDDYNIDIDIRDYIELNDYLPYNEWLENGNNFVAFKDWDLYLISDVE